MSIVTWTINLNLNRRYCIERAMEWNSKWNEYIYSRRSNTLSKGLIHEQILSLLKFVSVRSFLERLSSDTEYALLTARHPVHNHGNQSKITDARQTTSLYLYINLLEEFFVARRCRSARVAHLSCAIFQLR